MKVARRVSCMALLSALTIGTAWNRTLIGTVYRLTIALIAAVGSFCAFATAQTGGTSVVALTPVEMQWTTQGGLAAPAAQSGRRPGQTGTLYIATKIPEGLQDRAAHAPGFSRGHDRVGNVRDRIWRNV